MEEIENEGCLIKWYKKENRSVLQKYNRSH